MRTFVLCHHCHVVCFLYCDWFCKILLYLFWDIFALFMLFTNGCLQDLLSVHQFSSVFGMWLTPNISQKYTAHRADVFYVASTSTLTVSGGSRREDDGYASPTVCLWKIPPVKTKVKKQLQIWYFLKILYCTLFDMPSLLWRCWLGGRKGIRPVKNSGGVPVWLSVWNKVQTCIWPGWCHCHSLSLASVKSRFVLPFWYRLTWVVLEKGPLNGPCVCVHSVWTAKAIFDSKCIWKAFGDQALPGPRGGGRSDPLAGFQDATLWQERTGKGGQIRGKGRKGVEGSYCLLPILGSATEPPARAGKKSIL